MQKRRSFKSAIEISTKTMTESEEKKSRGPYRPFLEDAGGQSRTHTERGQTEVLPLSPPEKNSRYFWVPPRI